MNLSLLSELETCLQCPGAQDPCPAAVGTNENLGAKRDGNFSSQNATYQVPLREKGILPCVISNRCPMLKVLGDIDHHSTV